MTSPIRVAAVDDHPIFLAGLKRSLQSAKDIAFVAEGGCAADAIRIAREDRPDILLLDIAMPGDGVQAAQDILAENPAAKIVMLTASDDDDRALAAISAGASGYLLKGILVDELCSALRNVQAGSPYITQSISARLLLQSARFLSARTASEGVAGKPRLKSRDQQVLELLSQGLTNGEIAQRLELSPATIKSYISRIFDVLKVRNRAEAISKHLRANWPPSA